MLQWAIQLHELNFIWPVIKINMTILPDETDKTLDERHLRKGGQPEKSCQPKKWGLKNIIYYLYLCVEIGIVSLELRIDVFPEINWELDNYWQTSGK